VESFEQKALDNFGSLIINKAFARKAGFGSRAIPVYVREWIVAHYVGDSPDIDEEARAKISEFVHKYVPDKSEREMVKNQLFEQQDVKLLDDYSVLVNLEKGDRYLIIPFLDESHGGIPPQILRENDMLLKSGVWGVGTLFYAPPSEKGKTGQTILRQFTPFQLASLDLDYFISTRKCFTTQEWIDFIVNSMGFNHTIYSERQKILLISRLLPMVEPRYNLVELAPKGTGKSFVFENMSRYVSVRSGAVTAAVLFFNDARKTPGLITRYDCVVIDEAQKVRGDSSGELTALLKSYLESGRFGRGSAGAVTSEAGLVMLANIELDERHQPIYDFIGLFRAFPNFLRETAFIDRFSGLLPGWDLPRVTKDTPSVYMGLKGDIFGEILHMLRGEISYRDYVKLNMRIENCDDMRDNRAIEAGATGLLKILFPDREPGEEEFYKYCVNPALELRQRVRDELCKMDREYTPVTMRSRYPDHFQLSHYEPTYVDPDQLDSAQAERLQLAHLEKSAELSQPIELPQPTPSREEPPIVNVVEMEPKEEELKEKTVHIKENQTGYSYKNLFGPYLKYATEIKLYDPYIRLEFQIRNLIAFIDTIDTIDGPVHLHLVTTAADNEQEVANSAKFEEIAANASQHGITFTYEYSGTLHRRGAEMDNGWRIIIDRGLDLYQKPLSRYELSEVDQTKRKCRETEILFVREE